MDFEKRLQQAIARGQNRGSQQAREDQARALSEDELKRLHNQYRLTLSEHIERCVQKVVQQWPGFDVETIFGDRGWGAACSRDDFQMRSGRRDDAFSRLELTVRPFNNYHVLELAGKATVRNKEIFRRNFFEPLAEAAPGKFVELIDVWVLEFAELYAAS